MGRLIEEMEIYKRLRPKVDNGTLDEIMLDIPTVEAIPKADYEARLKADLVAMLTEIQLEIEEVARCPYTECVGEDCPFQDCMIHKGRVVALLQEKIDKLKET